MKCLIYINVVFEEKRSATEILKVEDKFLPIIRAGYVRLDLCHSRIKILSRILQVINIWCEYEQLVSIASSFAAFPLFSTIVYVNSSSYWFKLKYRMEWCSLLSWKILSNTLAVRINKQFEMVCGVRLEK